MSKRKPRIYRGEDGEPRLYVCSKRCDQCLFSSAKIIGDAAKEEVLTDCRERQSHFICHKHSIRDSRANVCCKGFFEEEHTLEIILARSLGIVVFVGEDGLPV